MNKIEHLYSPRFLACLRAVSSTYPYFCGESELAEAQKRMLEYEITCAELAFASWCWVRMIIVDKHDRVREEYLTWRAAILARYRADTIDALKK